MIVPMSQNMILETSSDKSQNTGGYGIPSQDYGFDIPNSFYEGAGNNLNILPEPYYIKEGFLTESGLIQLGLKKGLHFDGFEEDHEDGETEEYIEQSERQESITSSENADNNRL
jgi:hypothetical protein